MKISFCTWIKNRLWQYCQCLKENLDRADGYDVEFILLDNQSTDGLYDWLSSTGLLKRITYVSASLELHQCILKNASHKLGTGDILVNLDCDNVIGYDYCKTVLANVTDTQVAHYWSGDWSGGTFGRIAYTKKSFENLGGYDESFNPQGNEDCDIIDRAKGLKCKILESKDPNLVGYAIRNSREQSDRVFDVPFHISNQKNYTLSQANLKAGRFVANQKPK